MKRTNIGFGIKTPEKVCDDNNCPFHGTLKIRTANFTGIVTSAKRQKTATVVWSAQRFVSKFERYKKISTKISAHNPPCVDAEEGDKVKIHECRRLSKTVAFVIVEKSGKDETYLLQKHEAEEQKEKEEQQTKKKKITKQANKEKSSEKHEESQMNSPEEN